MTGFRRVRGFEILSVQKAEKGEIIIPDNAAVTPKDLSLVLVKHIGFDGMEHDGRLICGRRLSHSLMKIFKELYDLSYPIEKIIPSARYGGDDDKIMSDNSTSCFNYRTVANSDNLSLHAWGRAVDINPLYNPYIQNGVVMPSCAEYYADRSKDFPHKITHDDICYKVFRKHGWKWGGDWRTDKDYQHFYR